MLVSGLSILLSTNLALNVFPFRIALFIAEYRTWFSPYPPGRGGGGWNFATGVVFTRGLSLPNPSTSSPAGGV